MTPETAMGTFETLQKYYRERELAANEWKASGGKVVGYICENVPQEIIYAAGMLPVKIVGDPETATTVGDVYMEESFCSHVRALFDKILRGKYNYLDGIVIPHSCDAIIRMAKYLWTVRDMDGIEFPNMHWLDMPHHRGLISYEYFYDRVEDFKQAMEKLSGNIISNEALFKAINVYNKNRTLLQNIAELRKVTPPRISFTEVLPIIGAGACIPKDRHNELLEQLLKEIDKFPAKSGARLFFCGSCMDNAAVAELIESCGAIIVGDNSCMGDRYSEDLVEPLPDPIEAITRRYLFKSPCPRTVSMRIRIQDFAKRLENTKSEGVIFYLFRWCDANMWDYVGLAKETVKFGIPHYYFDMQEYHLANPESLRTRIEALVEVIGGAT